MFKSSTPTEVIDAAAADVVAGGGTITHRYSATIKGFAATLPDAVFTTLSASEHVDTIEADGEVSTLATAKGL
ncbi:hypothetical protein HK405_013245 [Cladochytrium tenue]|nr:hypothetical protein HK405_013245 [Cladochytrium tenue]